MKKEIPIRNVYFLLSYAWDFISRGNEKTIGTDNFTNASNLFAKLLDVTLEHLAKKGLANDYIYKAESIAGIKGRFDLTSSIKSGSLLNGKAICEFDEHGPDHLVNQIIKATILLLLKQKDLDESNIDILNKALIRFHQMSDIKLHPSVFLKVKLNNNNRHYRFILELCRLVCESQIISSESREILLTNFMNDSLKMDRVFEKFVKNFYTYHLREYTVSSPIYQWKIESTDHFFVEGIPELRTDVLIENSDKRIIIDAKFYLEAMKQTFVGSFKFRRDHLSQLMEYMRTSQIRSTKKTYGMLLYPTVDSDINTTGNIENLLMHLTGVVSKKRVPQASAEDCLSFFETTPVKCISRIENFTVKIATIDLSKNWEEIEHKLLSLVGANSFHQIDRAA